MIHHHHHSHHKHAHIAPAPKIPIYLPSEPEPSEPTSTSVVMRETPQGPEIEWRTNEPSCEEWNETMEEVGFSPEEIEELSMCNET